MGRPSLGEFEHLILLAVLHLGEDAYGVPIAEVVEERTGRDVNQSAVYLTLRRLEEKGWLESSVGEPTPTRGGRAKRFFTVTAAGAERLRQARGELVAMWKGLGPAFGS